MNPEELKVIIEQSLTCEHLDVTVDGSHAFITVVSEVFEGLNTVKRQQTVYAALNDSIASGALHAVHMKTYTPAQWQAQ